MTTQLVKYDAARTALAEAASVDEVKEIRDKAEGLAAYARQAKDTDMLRWATEIKLRAERKVGKLLRETGKQAGARGVGKKVESPRSDSTPPSLKDLGITKRESSDWQKIAAIPEKKFEEVVAAANVDGGGLTTRALVRAARPAISVRPVRVTKKKKSKAAKKKPAPLAEVLWNLESFAGSALSRTPSSVVAEFKALAPKLRERLVAVRQWIDDLLACFDKEKARLLPGLKAEVSAAPEVR